MNNHRSLGWQIVCSVLCDHVFFLTDVKPCPEVHQMMSNYPLYWLYNSDCMYLHCVIDLGWIVGFGAEFPGLRMTLTPRGLDLSR